MVLSAGQLRPEKALLDRSVFFTDVYNIQSGVPPLARRALIAKDVTVFNWGCISILKQHGVSASRKLFIRDIFRHTFLLGAGV